LHIDTHNLAKSSTSSKTKVLLKVLEHYEGLLFLMTSLLTFDIAVQSRVHLAVRFPDMFDDEVMQMDVLRMVLRQIKKDAIERTSSTSS